MLQQAVLDKMVATGAKKFRYSGLPTTAGGDKLSDCRHTMVIIEGMVGGG